MHRLEYILRLCDESAYFVVPGLRLAQDATVWPSFIVLFLTISRPFIPGCSGQVQTQPAAGLRTDAPTSEGHPSPSPLLLPRNSYKYFACPPFFAQIIYPHTTPLKIIQTTLSFWRRQSLLSKRAISHPLPPKIVARSNLRPEETLRARGTKSG